jgi:hypothetical protein
VDRVDLAAACWQMAVLQRLRDQMHRRGLREVTVPEALALLGAEPCQGPVEAVLYAVLDRKDDRP